MRFVCLLLLGWISLDAYAQPSALVVDPIGDPSVVGRAIAAEADRRDTGFVDSDSSFVMTLRDDRGRERVRRMRVQTLERDGEGDWSLAIFDQPADVKGTALLTYAHGIDPDDQWIYLPALRRVKRISSSNRSGPFMGSEFAFEDMSSFELEKYDYRFLREEPCAEQLQCYVSQWLPLYQHSGYSRTVSWIDQQEFRTWKVEFYDTADRLKKTLTLSDYRLFAGRFWRPMHWEMTNHLTGKTTVLDYERIEFGTGLDARDFDQNALKRAK